jgi:large subunit ribosomal protein L23
MATKEKKPKKEEAKKGKTHPLILGARITEKSALGADHGIYTFNVKPEANKNEIRKAIKFIYDVTPVKISITKITRKVVMRRGIIGIKQGGKKAVVHLKKGDKITFV